MEYFFFNFIQYKKYWAPSNMWRNDQTFTASIAAVPLKTTIQWNASMDWTWPKDVYSSYVVCIVLYRYTERYSTIVEEVLTCKLRIFPGTKQRDIITHKHLTYFLHLKHSGDREYIWCFWINIKLEVSYQAVKYCQSVHPRVEFDPLCICLYFSVLRSWKILNLVHQVGWAQPLAGDSTCKCK